MTQVEQLLTEAGIPFFYATDEGDYSLDNPTPEQEAEAEGILSAFLDPVGYADEQANKDAKDAAKAIAGNSVNGQRADTTSNPGQSQVLAAMCLELGLDWIDSDGNWAIPGGA